MVIGVRVNAFKERHETEEEAIKDKTSILHKPGCIKKRKRGRISLEGFPNPLAYIFPEDKNKKE